MAYSRLAGRRGERHAHHVGWRNLFGQPVLALSDLVSNKTALDTLNASGKMIGVISHVESLKESLSAQIRVEKGGGIGHSRLVV